MRIICLFLTLLLATSFLLGENSESLIIYQNIFEARIKFIKKLLKEKRFRESLEELNELKPRVTQNSKYFIDYWMGITYQYLGRALDSGYMLQDKKGKLLYFHEADVQMSTKHMNSIFSNESEVLVEKDLAAPRYQESLLETSPENLNKNKKSSHAYFERALHRFNILIDAKNNPFKEDVVVKKIETLADMDQLTLAVEECEFFIKAFPDSTQVVEVKLKKADLLFKLESYMGSIKTLEKLLLDYPQTEYKNYIQLKINYIKILAENKGMPLDTQQDAENRIKKKIELLKEFEEDIKSKENKLKELESILNKSE